MTDPADAERRQRQLETLDRLAQRFGASMSDAFGRSAADRKWLDGVLGQVGRTLANAALKGALKPAQASLKTGFESLFKGLFSGEGAPATPFAKGGVVAAPSYFPLGRGLGLMGEQGAEAILPLARGPDGRLGVRAASRSSRVSTKWMQWSTAPPLSWPGLSRPSRLEERSPSHRDHRDKPGDGKEAVPGTRPAAA